MVPEPREKLWDYDAVEPGQEGPPTVVALTAGHIAAYARVAQNRDPRFQGSGANAEYGGALVAMPTMVLTYAPLLRREIAEHQGFVALEDSETARRQTPFAKCEIRWFRPVLAGDTLTGTRRVLEKYERRGSRFITFRVEASNLRGEHVATYDYTCIFSYVRGQRDVPRDPGIAEPLLPGAEAAATASNQRCWLAFDAVAIGDPLAPLVVSESQEIIDRKNELRLAGKPNPSNIHTDEAFARQNIFGGTVNSGPATMSYVDQMLERSFPLRAFYDGGRLLMRAITPFRAGDTVTFAGNVTDKRLEDGNRIVDCRVRGINQRGELVCLSDATMMLPA
ncbi:MAG: MaoC family dehydratase [Betaproteobacteria bacterium]|nr:MaoC family dehydratase [Betaproteobacteria bacterium]